MKRVSKHHIGTENATKSSSKATAHRGTATPKWQNNQCHLYDPGDQDTTSD